MQIGVPKEIDPLETRCAMTPEAALKLVRRGASVVVEAGVGATCHFADEAYVEAGCRVEANRDAVLSASDIVLRVCKPLHEEVGKLKKGACHVSFLDPFNERELIGALTEHGVSAMSMEMVPRSTRAQKLDALSSQHSLAGYYMVLLAAERLGKALPMMMTPAGKIQPARVFVIGAGVAGLQAIATAKRLGARVEAFDTRPVVKTEVESIGAKFVEIDLGDTGQTDQGYAKELTDEQKAKQREGMKRHCAQSDIVITTAALFGRKAPIVIDADMVGAMRAGAVIVDYAAATGGNVEGSVLVEETDIDGVKVIGFANYPGHIAMDASRMYANNLTNLILEFWDDEEKTFVMKQDDEIIERCLITHGGALVNGMIRKAYGLTEVAAS